MSGRTGPIKVFVNPSLMDLLPAYLKRRDADVENLRSHIETHDFEAIRIIGHKLCGNGALMGMEQLSSTGKELEAAATEKDLDKIREYTESLFEYLKNIEISPMEDK